jgi:hypothetical protein
LGWVWGMFESALHVGIWLDSNTAIRLRFLVAQRQQQCNVLRHYLSDAEML